MGTGLFEETCHTTKGVSQDGETVPCTTDAECEKDWKCAEPCGLLKKFG